MFPQMKMELRCECVYSAVVKDYSVIGAYVVNPYDQAILKKALLEN